MHFDWIQILTLVSVLLNTVVGVLTHRDVNAK